MSQPLNKTPRTLPRVQRREIHNFDEGDSHLWAVSYADLLMVLLAFFVIFFSMEPPAKTSPAFQKFAAGLQGAGFGPALSEGSSAGSAKTNPDSPPEVNLMGKHLSAIVPGEVNVEGENIQILLPDNAFTKGQYQLDAPLRAKLDQIYETLRPFERDLKIVVIGHADSMRFAQRRSEYLGDNFDLSSLRALRALQYVLAKGFPHEQISAQGAADGVRNSRTLSLKVSWKESR